MGLEKIQVDLGDVQETLLIPLYGRAAETSQRNAVLRDPKAVEMVHAIDYDFTKFAGSRTLRVTVLRTALLDTWVRRFLSTHPTGTVVEVGAGLNTRFERLDNDMANWVDIDLPDSMTLRRRFFTETDRRRLVAASVLDGSWIQVVREQPPPYFFAIEAVLVYLTRDQVERALRLIQDNFSGSLVAFDTMDRHLIDTQKNRSRVLKNMAAQAQWACDDLTELRDWGLDVKVLETHAIADPPPELRRLLPTMTRLWLTAFRTFNPRMSSAYLMHLTRLGQ